MCHGQHVLACHLCCMLVYYVNKHKTTAVIIYYSLHVCGISYNILYMCLYMHSTSHVHYAPTNVKPHPPHGQ